MTKKKRALLYVRVAFASLTEQSLGCSQGSAEAYLLFNRQLYFRE
jgi:hypothetical protein